MDIEKGVSNLDSTWSCDMGEGGGGIIEIDIEDCGCEILELVSPLDTRNPDEIPF